MSSTTFDWRPALKWLTETIPPPASPLFTEPTADPAFLAELPPDFRELVSIYGSGSFEHVRKGEVVRAFNPNAPLGRKSLDDVHETLTNYREAEAGEIPPIPIHPVAPGLRVWGKDDRRNYYAWHTADRPNEWPVMYFCDAEVLVPFAMPVVVFLQQLFTGQISWTQLGYAVTDDRMSAADISFRPWGKR